MSRRRGKDPDKIFKKVHQAVMSLFKKQYDSQALQHVRHKVKRDVECKIDAKFSCISAMEIHLRTLIDKLKPREQYNALRKEFSGMLAKGDYAGVLRVFNYKPMLSECNIAPLLGYPNKDAYISAVLGVLKGVGKDARRLRAAIKYCFGLDLDNNFLSPGEEVRLPDDDTEPVEKMEEKIERQRRQSKRQGKKYHRGRRL